MATYRIDRINKELLRSISEMLHTRIKRDDVKEAILTNVDCSRDLGHAKVYFTLIDESKGPEVQKALESVAGQLRSFLGKEMHLRTVPELHFIFDESEKKAREMDRLLDSIASADGNKQE
ncbi:30S ribosome-binding factor RbfA [Synergistaceae bacterium OttesenSCG-928-D05]|nr:30S ribosome-binding factor RbfA [Synergistaceae bacterium OttesenSCG-928-D05]